jgi:hypothetical protein
VSETTPTATPEELAEAITGVDAVAHANAQSRYGGSGVEREINVWFDGETSETTIDGVRAWIGAAGYSVEYHGETDTGNIWIEGRA